MKNDNVSFLPCEDDILLRLVLEFGTRWSLIKEHFNKHVGVVHFRDTASLRHRLTRIQKNEKLGRTPSKPKPCEGATKKLLQRGMSAFRHQSMIAIQARFVETRVVAFELGMWPSEE